MPKIDLMSAPVGSGSRYPAPFDEPCKGLVAASGGRGRAHPVRRESSVPSARRLVQPAPLARTRRRVRLHP
jgi:hypothetical protein